MAANKQLIEIEIRSAAGITKKINATLDPRFNGYVQLPLVEAFPLGLYWVG